MSGKRSAFVRARESLLAEIKQNLHRDERFQAAWLVGSYGRNEQNWYSDLDIQVVVADTFSDSLCSIPFPPEKRTTPARLAMFEQFGAPAVIYEDLADVPTGGTTTTVLYASAIT